MREKIKPTLSHIDDLLDEVGQPSTGGKTLDDIDALLGEVQSGVQDKKSDVAGWTIDRRRKEAADSSDAFVLNMLSMDEELVVRSLTFCNPHVPAPSLRRRVEQGATNYELMIIAHNPQATSELLDRIAEQSGEREVLDAVCANPNVSVVTKRKVGNASVPSAEDQFGSWTGGLDAPQGEPDDLKKIPGINVKIEQRLNDVGVYHLWQLAQLDSAGIAALDRTLRLRGRIEQDDWVGQAKNLTIT